MTHSEHATIGLSGYWTLGIMDRHCGCFPFCQPVVIKMHLAISSSRIGIGIHYGSVRSPSGKSSQKRRYSWNSIYI